MGFFPTATEVVLRAHGLRPITGRALMIGRQNTGLIPGEAKHLIERNGIPLLRDDFDGSSLDNIFNVATAMQNVSALLKPGGRCGLMNWSNSFPTAYAMLSPEWVMDFFAYQEYEVAGVLVVAAKRCSRAQRKREPRRIPSSFRWLPGLRSAAASPPNTQA